MIRATRIVRALVLATALALASAVAEASRPPHPRLPPPGPYAELRAAPLPLGLGAIAVHTFLVVQAPECGDERPHRFEVWQHPVGGPGQHVARDLFPNADHGVGGGAPWVERTWTGDEARRLAARLEASLHDYPARDRYLPWPGPNCNTYVAWALREAGVPGDLPPTAIGKDWLGLAGAARSTTGTGLQVESAVVGLRAGLDEGVELHLFGLTFGAGLWPPVVKTPLGRIGGRR